MRTLRRDIVVHATTVHVPSDARIFSKECMTLAEAGYRVMLIATADQDEWRGPVRLLAIPRFDRRLKRMMLGNLAVFRRALRSGAFLIHFHDPELLPCLIALRVLGRTVVMDIHEDLPKQLQRKGWLAPRMRDTFSSLARVWERLVSVVANNLVTAAPSIYVRLPEGSTLVQNFPRPDEFDLGSPTDYALRAPTAAYVGSITLDRGAIQMIQAIDRIPADLDASLVLGGPLDSPDVLAKMEEEPGWSRTTNAGWLERSEVVELLGRVRIGLVVLHPTPSYIDAQPTKLFEYMLAGLPVVSSDFPRCREIVNSSGCGLLVDPSSPDEIAGAVRWLLEHPSESEKMGERGRQAVLQDYNWYPEGERLVQMYRSLGGRPGAS